MARAPQDRSKPIPYDPLPPPVPSSTQQEVTRAVWDELRRIAEALAALQPPP